MAIFGDLQDHAFTDVAKVIKRQTGSLFLHRAYQGQTVELILQRDRIQGAFVDGFHVTQGSKLREILFYLVTHNEGRFEFDETPLQVDLRPAFNDYLSELLQQVVAEANVPEDQLPHADTRFIVDPSGSRVPSSLAERWEQLRPLMLRGCSASELTRHLPHSERELRVTLHQLRAVGLILPQRAMPGHQSAPLPEALPVKASSAPEVAPPAPRPLVHRLMNALRRMTGTVRS